MANKGLFASAVARLLAPPADILNRELAPAYAYGPEHKLAQLAATGTLQDAFHAAAETHLGAGARAAGGGGRAAAAARAEGAGLRGAARAVDPLFAARAAVFARTRGAMKDMPALLTA